MVKNRASKVYRPGFEIFVSSLSGQVRASVARCSVYKIRIRSVLLRYGGCKF